MLDGVGNVVGGIRTPWVDVPVARLSGDPPGGSGFCFLFGQTELLDEPTLQSLYPTRRDYVKKYKRSARETLKAGFFVRKDVKLMRKSAKASTIVPE